MFYSCLFNINKVMIFNNNFKIRSHFYLYFGVFTLHYILIKISTFIDYCITINSVVGLYYYLPARDDGHALLNSK